MIIKRAVLAVTVLLLALAGQVATTPAAQATGDVTGTGIDLTFLKKTCYAETVTFTNLDPAVTTSLSVNDPATADSPAGSQIWSASDVRGATDYTGTFVLCPRLHPSGTYTLRARGVAVGSFTVVRPTVTLVRVHQRVEGARASCCDTTCPEATATSPC